MRENLLEYRGTIL